MAFEPKPVYRPRQQVEQQLRRAIISGELRDGDRLPSEASLAERFGVARSTVREALGSLRELGLIEKAAGKGGGSFVKSIDVQSLASLVSEAMEIFIQVGNASTEDVAHVRELLEIPSARLAAVQRSQEDVANLYRIVEIQQHATIDDPDISHLDVNFHAAIAEASGNRVLGAFVLALHSVAEPVNKMALSAEIGRDTVAQHLKVVRAIEARNPDAAEQAIRAHLGYLKEVRSPLESIG